MVNCLHYHEDVECTILYLVVFLVSCVIVAVIYQIVKRILKQRRDKLKHAGENPPHALTEVNTQDVFLVTCVIVAGIYHIFKPILKQRRDNLKCAGENPPHALTEANTQGSKDKRAHSKEVLAGLKNVKDEQNCRCYTNEIWKENTLDEPVVGVTRSKPIVDRDEQKAANSVAKTSNTKDNRKQVFVLLKDDILRVCIDTLLKGTGLIPNYNEQTVYENGKFKFEDETSTIIVVRHGSTRIDSDVAGCCKHIADSDMKRTVVVIINEYANNKKGEHGEIIKPNSYDIDNINDLKNVVVFNYKCCIEKKQCKRCKDSMDEFKQHASSPNYK
ncbi:uncharacterized protein LOC132749653 [Ruditapes philippinarum]|uniref:uncharacterized protein LOC132749653 n=1 Tax=Ruditapes philippinarum TaxID=129788 RepID=UPI00295A68A2|nr:uncharacterized protein LOC132749653 [Ruditapes philippinarum]